MLTGLASLVPKLKFLLNENSTTILTGMGVTGTVATAYLTGRATFKAAEILVTQELDSVAEERIRLEDKGEPFTEIETPMLTKMEKARLVWKLYILPAGVGLTTVASIITANRISSKRIAALVVASGVSERALAEYKAKVIDRLGAKEDQKTRDAIAQDRISNNPPTGQEVIFAGSGEVLCYDMLTGRYFNSTVEKIKSAENKINHDLVHFMSASLTDFYDELGLAPTTYTDSVGWNGVDADLFKVVFTTTMSTDNRPCIAIDFERPPVPEYASHRYS